MKKILKRYKIWIYKVNLAFKNSLDLSEIDLPENYFLSTFLSMKSLITLIVEQLNLSKFTQNFISSLEQGNREKKSIKLSI